MTVPFPFNVRTAAGVMGICGGGRAVCVLGLVPIRARSSPGTRTTMAGFSSKATSGGTASGSWPPCSRLCAASLGDSSVSVRLFIGLFGTRILMPDLARSILRRSALTVGAAGGAAVGAVSVTVLVTPVLLTPAERLPFCCCVSLLCGECCAG